MKKGVVGILFTVMASSYSPKNAIADNNFETEKKYERLEQILKFGAGVATQYGLHEAGHYIGARASGTDITFNRYGNWSFSGNPSDNQKLITYSGGFVVPMLASEIALRSETFPKRSSYVKGIVSGQLFHNLTYVIRDSTGNISKKHNDIEGLEEAGLSKKITYPLLLGIPAWQFWRSSRASKNNQIKNFKKANWNIKIIPLRENGLAIKVSKKF